MAPHVISMGSVIVDMTMRLAAIPEVGGDVLAETPKLDVGGGFNLMRAAVRQGALVTYGGVVGTGPRGALVTTALDEHRIAMGQKDAAETDMDTGLCITFVDDNAERSFVTAPGAEAHLTREGLHGIEVRKGDWVALSGYDLVYDHASDALAGWVSTLPPDVGVLLDPGPLVLDIAPPVWNAVVGRINVLTVNDREARLLAGISDSNEPRELHRHIRALHRMRAASVLVIRQGERGCTFDGDPDHDGTVEVPAIPVKAIDTTGAGDTHTGVFLAERLLGSPTRDALHRANVAAAISVGRSGPATSPSRTEVDTALAALITA